MLVERASVVDVMAWAAERRRHGFPLPRTLYKCLLAQAAVFEAYVFREAAGGDPVVIAGCVDLGSGSAAEIFFLAKYGGLGRRLVCVHRLASRLLSEAAVTRPNGLVCHVRTREGARLARLLGFEPEAIVADGIERWRLVWAERSTR
jgi:hypothetical protein